MRLIGPNCMGIINTDPSVSAQRNVLAGLPANRESSNV